MAIEDNRSITTNMEEIFLLQSIDGGGAGGGGGGGNYLTKNTPKGYGYIVIGYKDKTDLSDSEYSIYDTPMMKGSLSLGSSAVIDTTIPAGSEGGGIAVGYQNMVIGPGSYQCQAFGNSNTINAGNATFVTGYSNKIGHGGSASFIAGQNNSIYLSESSCNFILGQSNALFGCNQNVILGYGNEAYKSSYGNVIMNQDNAIDGYCNYNMISGYANQLKNSCSYNIIGGNANKIFSSMNQGLISGQGNKTLGNASQCMITGNENKIVDSYCGLIGGSQNKIVNNGTEAITIGDQNLVNNAYCSLTFGQYNNVGFNSGIPNQFFSQDFNPIVCINGSNYKMTSGRINNMTNLSHTFTEQEKETLFNGGTVDLSLDTHGGPIYYINSFRYKKREEGSTQILNAKTPICGAGSLNIFTLATKDTPFIRLGGFNEGKITFINTDYEPIECDFYGDQYPADYSTEPYWNVSKSSFNPNSNTLYYVYTPNYPLPSYQVTLASSFLGQGQWRLWDSENHTWTDVGNNGLSRIGNSTGSIVGGYQNRASGSYSAVFGQDNHVQGDAVFVAGHSNTVSNLAASAFGKENTVSANCAHAEGWKTTASAVQSHAEGQQTTASGNTSHAEGYLTTASNEASHAEGFNTIASGVHSHAEGYYTIASNYQSHAEGKQTTASGENSHAEGSGYTEEVDNETITHYTTASGYASHAEGYTTTASGSNSHAEGYYAIARGSNSHAEGSRTTANEYCSHAEGASTTASGDYSHAEGYGTIASGSCSHAGGDSTKSEGSSSFSHGLNRLYVSWTINYHQIFPQADREENGKYYFDDAQSLNSVFIELDSYPDYPVMWFTGGGGGNAYYNQTTEEFIGSFGFSWDISNENKLMIYPNQTIYEVPITSTIELPENCYINSWTSSNGGGTGLDPSITDSGFLTSGEAAIGLGNSILASGDNQTVIGKYNTEDSNKAFIIGNGSISVDSTTLYADLHRSNALTVDWNGNQVLAGKLTVGTAPTANMDVTTKQYVDGLTSPLSTRVTTLETTVGNNTSGLVKDVNDLQTEVETATTGLLDRVDNIEDVLNTPNTGLIDRVTILENMLTSATRSYDQSTLVADTYNITLPSDYTGEELVDIYIDRLHYVETLDYTIAEVNDEFIATFTNQITTGSLVQIVITKIASLGGDLPAAEGVGF